MTVRSTNSASLHLSVIILAAGVSSRMSQSLGTSGTRIVKGMMHFHDTPLLDYQLYHASEAGITDIILVVGEESSTLRERYGFLDTNNAFHGLTISYVQQRIPEGRTKPLGTADAVLQALRSRHEWPHSVLVCNSDNLYSSNALRSLSELDNDGGWIDYDIQGLRFEDEHVAQFGLTTIDEHGFLTGITEKPGIEEVQRLRSVGNVYVTMNLWKLPVPLIIPYLESCPMHEKREEKELTTAITSMIRDHPQSMKAVPLSEHVPDLTDARDIEEMSEHIRSHFPKPLWI